MIFVSCFPCVVSRSGARQDGGAGAELEAHLQSGICRIIPRAPYPLNACKSDIQTLDRFSPSFWSCGLNTMVRLRELPRTATFAWSPGSGKPLLVTGTRAGAVDADFSDESKLELWDLALDDQQQGLELQPIASIPTESRYEYICTTCVCISDRY